MCFLFFIFLPLFIYDDEGTMLHNRLALSCSTTAPVTIAPPTAIAPPSMLSVHTLYGIFLHFYSLLFCVFGPLFACFRSIFLLCFHLFLNFELEFEIMMIYELLAELVCFGVGVFYSFMYVIGLNMISFGL